jgi:inositol transport system substrate-binding protein
MTLRWRKLAAVAALATALAVTGANADPKYRLAYLARAQSDSFAVWLANSITAEVKKYPDLSVSVFDGRSDNEAIQSLIEETVQSKFDLTIIQPYDPPIQIGPVKDAMSQGMKFIATNPKFEDDSIPSVDASPYQQGAENAKLALNQIPKGANVVVLLGPAGNPHSIPRRMAWQKEFFDKRPDVKILDEQIANWNKDEGQRLMEDWIQAHPKIDAVISMNDNMAVGAIEAIEGSGGKVNPLVYGVDGTAAACLLIKDGKARLDVITALSACKGCALRPIEGQGRQPRSGKPRSGPRSLEGLSHQNPGNDAEREQGCR